MQNVITNGQGKKRGTELNYYGYEREREDPKKSLILFCGERRREKQQKKKNFLFGKEVDCATYQHI